MVLMLIPKERLNAVRALLMRPAGAIAADSEASATLENPWDDLLGPVDNE
jgi:hypothetical protein